MILARPLNNFIVDVGEVADPRQPHDRHAALGQTYDALNDEIAADAIPRMKYR